LNLCLQQTDHYQDSQKPERETAKRVIGDIVKTKGAELADLITQRKRRQYQLDKARDMLCKTQSKLNVASQRKTESDHRLADYVALRDGKLISRADASRLLRLLEVFLTSGGCENALVASFKQAALSQPADRMPVCRDSVCAVEMELIAIKSRFTEEENNLQVSVQSCSESVLRFENDIDALSRESHRLETELSAAEALLSKMQELDTFRSGVLAAYQWLLTRDRRPY